MTAKQNDIAYKALNIGIAAGILIGLYFLYKWLKNHVGGNGGTLFGGPGKVKTYGSASANSNGPNDLVSKIAKKTEEDLTSAPHTLVVAIQLEHANLQAKKFVKKQDTNIVINKALKAANALSDHDFMLAVKGFLALSNNPDLYKTPLAGNVSNTGSKSIFLSRYGELTGQIDSSAAYSAHSLAKS